MAFCLLLDPLDHVFLSSVVSVSLKHGMGEQCLVYRAESGVFTIVMSHWAPLSTQPLPNPSPALCAGGSWAEYCTGRL